MNFLVILLLSLFSAQSFSEQKELWELEADSPKRAWSVSGGHSYSRGLYYESSGTLSHFLNLSYNLKGKTINISTSYIQPFNQFVSDSSPYGVTDTSISSNIPLPFFTSFMEKFFNLKAGNSIGIVLPSSLKARRVGRYGSAFVSFYYFKKYSIFEMSFNHVLYSSFYKYRSNVSGYNPNRLASASHSVSLKWKYKKLSVKASGRFYLYAYLADHDPDPKVKDTKIKFKGSQGGSLSASLALPYSLSVYAQSSLNVPTISPILTGFPLFNYRNISYLAGLSWNF